jgi:hypothetical protein
MIVRHAGIAIYMGFTISLILSISKNSAEVIKRLYILMELTDEPLAIRKKIDTVMVLKLVMVSFFSTRVILTFVEFNMPYQGPEYNENMIILKDICTLLFVVNFLVILKTKEHYEDILFDDLKELDTFILRFRQFEGKSKSYS